MITIGSDFSGVGAFNQALIRSKNAHKEVFACDVDKFSRQTYILNFGTAADKEILKHPHYIKIADIFHKQYVDTKGGKRPTKEDLDYANANCEFIARQFSFYYPWNVYSRKIPAQSLGFYVSTPPCQSFSLAGKRKGEEDTRGILFYNTHEFICKNLPHYFIIENVKGLLSDDAGKTFARWLDLLGGKSVNGNPVIFPNDEAAPYHIYYQVLNAKECGVPQNRDRVFIVGIRDDVDNDFSFPKKIQLTKRLKDVLEKEVAEKYFLSDVMLSYLLKNSNEQKRIGNGFEFSPTNGNSVAKTISTKAGNRMSDDFIYVENNIINVGNVNPSGNGMNGNVFSESGIAPTLSTNKGEGIKIIGYTRSAQGKVTKRHEKDIAGTITTSTGGGGNTDQFVKVKSATKAGFEIATENDSINFKNRNSTTRRGRVGKGVAQALETECQQGVLIGAIRGGRTTRKNKVPTAQTLEINNAGVSNSLTTVSKDNVVVQPHRIRKLTPLECFRLMDFNFNIPDVPDFVWNVSDSQAYKQAGNSIPVAMLELLINRLIKK